MACILCEDFVEVNCAELAVAWLSVKSLWVALMNARTTQLRRDLLPTGGRHRVQSFTFAVPTEHKSHSTSSVRPYIYPRHSVPETGGCVCWR